MDKKPDPAIFSVDRKLYQLLKTFELLAFVNPVNRISEQRKFFRNKCAELPKFRYAPIKIDPYELKQKLGSLKTREITDISIRDLYESVISSNFDKIDLLATLGTRKFLYNSLRYFGRPSKDDLQNAIYLLHLPSIPSEPKHSPTIGANEAMAAFKKGLDSYGMKSAIEFNSKVLSKVMVLNYKKAILIRPDARFSPTEVNALIQHEIGVHMVTTLNSAKHKLKIFSLGLPVNTITQEGLAILAEYLSGNITLSRLKIIAQRVVVTDMMCSGADFIECYKYLADEQNVPQDDAYTVVNRIFRGGGFTKDYLYLSGFVKALELWKAGVNLDPLLIGKTSMDDYDIITEMIERDIVPSPEYITHSFLNPVQVANHEIYDYIIRGLK